MTDKPTITQADRDAAWIMRPYFIGEEEHDDWKIGGYDESASIRAFAEHREAAVAAVQAEVERLREALGWYGEQARLCRLIHDEGDLGRNALDADGGSRALAALAQKEPVQ